MAEDVDVRYQPLLDDDEEQDNEYIPERRRSRPRVWLIILIIVLLLLLAGGGFYYWQANRTPPVRYTTAAVTTGNISTTISATGPISANATYPLNFSQPGQVSAVNVKVGQSVSAGQVLASVNVNGNSSRVANLTAPEAATVAAVNGVVGQNVGGGGGNSSSAFMTLIDLSKINIVAQVNETDYANVKVGQFAQFTVASYPSATFHATVSSVDLVGQTSSSVVTFPVHLSVDLNSIPSGDHLYPDMTATVAITTAQRIGTVLVPAAAVSFTSTAIQNGEVSRSALTGLNQGTTGSSTSGSGSSRVVLTLNNGKLTPVLIQTGLSNGQYYEVLSGLQPDQQVVVSQTGGTTSNSTSPTTRNRTGGGFGGSGGGGGAGGGGGTRQGG